MTTFKGILTIPAVAAALFLGMDAPEAEAGGFSLRIGGGRGISINSGYNPYYRSGFNSFHSVNRGLGYGYGSHYSPYRSNYRHSSHYRVPVSRSRVNYFGPSVVPHGNHFDVIPGHYGRSYYGRGHYGYRGFHH